MIIAPSNPMPADQISLPLKQPIFFGSDLVVSKSIFTKRMQSILNSPHNKKFNNQYSIAENKAWQQKLSLIKNAIIQNDCQIGFYHYDNN